MFKLRFSLSTLILTIFFFVSGIVLVLNYPPWRKIYEIEDVSSIAVSSTHLATINKKGTITLRDLNGIPASLHQEYSFNSLSLHFSNSGYYLLGDYNIVYINQIPWKELTIDKDRIYTLSTDERWLVTRSEFEIKFRHISNSHNSINITLKNSSDLSYRINNSRLFVLTGNNFKCFNLDNSEMSFNVVAPAQSILASSSLYSLLDNNLEVDIRNNDNGSSAFRIKAPARYETHKKDLHKWTFFTDERTVLIAWSADKEYILQRWDLTERVLKEEIVSSKDRSIGSMDIRALGSYLFVLFSTESELLTDVYDSNRRPLLSNFELGAINKVYPNIIMCSDGRLYDLKYMEYVAMTGPAEQYAFINEGLLFSKSNNKVSIFKKYRTERWTGIFELLEFWSFLAIFLIVCIYIKNNKRVLKL